MTLDQVKTYSRLALRLLGLLAVVGGVLVVGLLGWQWQATVKVERLAVTGTTHAPADTVRRLTRVDSGTVMETIDAALVADRVARHPWIKNVDVTKQRARRVLHVAVTERTPAALVIDEQGRPAYYLDRNGYGMRTVDSLGYDVPLVRGLETAYHPVQRLAPSALRRALAALKTTDTEALVSEVTVHSDGGVGLVTVPMGGHGALPVRLGEGNFAAKLRQLRAFTEQVLATSPDASIAEIDLRFDGQIVTRPKPLDG